MKYALSLFTLLCAGAAQAATPTAQGRVDAFLRSTIVTATKGTDVTGRCGAALALGAEVQAGLEQHSRRASIDGDLRPFDALYKSPGIDQRRDGRPVLDQPRLGCP